MEVDKETDGEDVELRLGNTKIIASVQQASSLPSLSIST